MLSCYGDSRNPSHAHTFLRNRPVHLARPIIMSGYSSDPSEIQHANMEIHVSSFILLETDLVDNDHPGG